MQHRGESMLIKAILVVSLFAEIAIAQTAQDDSMNAGIVYGDNHAFAVGAPKGWVLDNSSGVNQGIYAVFYPKGRSWRESPAVMYVNTASKSVKGNETIEQLIAFDVEQSQERDSLVKVVELPSLLTKDHKTARVREFAHSNYEAVAYIDEETIITLICLTARTKAQYDGAYPAFEELVASYFFMTKNVSLPK
jgi:predicted secreted acid phosphatase